MVKIRITHKNGLILLTKPIKNDTTELVFPIISVRGVRYSIYGYAKGGMHKLWWACLDLNQSLFVPNEQA